MPKQRQYDTTRQHWREKIEKHNQTQFEKLNKKPGRTPQQEENIDWEEMQQWHREQWQFFISFSTVTQYKPGWLTTFLLLNMLIATTIADKKIPTGKKKGKIESTANDIVENHSPSAYAHNPTGIWTKEQPKNYDYYYSANDSRMKPYRDDPDLYSLVNQVEITYDPTDYLGAGISQQEYDAVCSEMTKIIRINLAYSINTEILKKIIKSQGLSITIRSPHRMNGVGGAYDYRIHTIIMAWDKNFSETEIKIALRNELHHVAVCFKNGGKTEKCLTTPKPKELNKILEEGYKKIADYKKLFDSGKTNKEIEEFLTKISDYDPIIIPSPMKKYDHEMLLKQPGVKILKDGRLFVPKGSAPLPGTLGQNDFYVTFYQIDTDTLLYKISFAKDNSAYSKAKAFFLDIEYRRSYYQTGGYNDSSFFNKNLSNKVSEFASDIELLSPALKQLFFPKFCEMFSKFHKVDNYCERPTIEMQN